MVDPYVIHTIKQLLSIAFVTVRSQYHPICNFYITSQYMSGCTAQVSLHIFL